MKNYYRNTTKALIANLAEHLVRHYVIKTQVYDRCAFTLTWNNIFNPKFAKQYCLKFKSGPCSNNKLHQHPHGLNQWEFVNNVRNTFITENTMLDCIHQSKTGYLRPAAALFALSCLPISSLKLELPSALTPCNHGTGVNKIS